MSSSVSLFYKVLRRNILLDIDTGSESIICNQRIHYFTFLSKKGGNYIDKNIKLNIIGI